jgi:hypothetical protein
VTCPVNLGEGFVGGLSSSLDMLKEILAALDDINTSAVDAGDDLGV